MWGRLVGPVAVEFEVAPGLLFTFALAITAHAESEHPVEHQHRQAGPDGHGKALHTEATRVQGKEDESRNDHNQPVSIAHEQGERPRSALCCRTSVHYEDITLSEEQPPELTGTSDRTSTVPQPEAPPSDPATPPERPGEQPVIRRRARGCPPVLRL